MDEGEREGIIVRTYGTLLVRVLDTVKNGEIKDVTLTKEEYEELLKCDCEARTRIYIYKTIESKYGTPLWS